MTEISVGLTIVIPGSVDPGMNFCLEVKRLNIIKFVIEKQRYMGDNKPSNLINYA